jgi:hypothetical protein
MNDAQRYRTNAAECLSAAERRQSPYRTLAFTMAAYWLSLERQQKAVDELLANGGEGRGPHRPLPARAAMPFRHIARSQPTRATIVRPCQECRTTLVFAGLVPHGSGYLYRFECPACVAPS